MTTRQSHLAAGLAFIRERGSVTKNELAEHLGVTRHLVNGLVASWERTERALISAEGAITLGPRADATERVPTGARKLIDTSEGSDAWLVLEQLSHGPASISDLAGLLDKRQRDVRALIERMAFQGMVSLSVTLGGEK